MLTNVAYKNVEILKILVVYSIQEANHQHNSQDIVLLVGPVLKEDNDFTAENGGIPSFPLKDCASIFSVSLSFLLRTLVLSNCCKKIYIFQILKRGTI